MSTRAFITTLLLALLWVCPVRAELQSDKELTQLLLGDWFQTSAPVVVGAHSIYATNATFSSRAIFKLPNGQITVAVEGTWRIEKGILITKLTASSHPNMAPVGLESRDTLISMTKSEYRYRSEQGKEAVSTRPTEKQKIPAGK